MSGLGLTQMNSLLASQNTLKTVSNLSAHRTALKGEMGVLGAEIEADKGRGVDTAAKEERYGTIEENADGIRRTPFLYIRRSLRRGCRIVVEKNPCRVIAAGIKFKLITCCVNTSKMSTKWLQNSITHLHNTSHHYLPYITSQIHH